MKFHSAKAEKISVEWQEAQSRAGLHGCECFLINLKVLKQEKKINKMMKIQHTTNTTKYSIFIYLTNTPNVINYSIQRHFMNR